MAYENVVPDGTNTGRLSVVLSEDLAGNPLRGGSFGEANDLATLSVQQQAHHRGRGQHRSECCAGAIARRP